MKIILHNKEFMPPSPMNYSENLIHELDKKNKKKKKNYSPDKHKIL